MPLVSSCCCPRHVEWKHGEVTSDHLRSCSQEGCSQVVGYQQQFEKQGEEEKKLHFLQIQASN